MPVITYVVAKFDLGPLSDVVALSIAVFKATAVILFFMHVRHSSNLTKLTVVSGFLWLAFMIFITLSDYWTRGWLDTFASGPERLSQPRDAAWAPPPAALPPPRPPPP